MDTCYDMIASDLSMGVYNWHDGKEYKFSSSSSHEDLIANEMFAGAARVEMNGTQATMKKSA